jgi:hypothetical protein
MQDRIPREAHRLTDLTAWSDARDPTLRYPYFAQVAHEALPTEPEYLVVPSARHFTFVAPCPGELARRTPRDLQGGAGALIA